MIAHRPNVAEGVQRLRRRRYLAALAEALSTVDGVDHARIMHVSDDARRAVLHLHYVKLGETRHGTRIRVDSMLRLVNRMRRITNAVEGTCEHVAPRISRTHRAYRIKPYGILTVTLTGTLPPDLPRFPEVRQS